jgi:membrane-bound serine protease (ClpP class)
MKSILPYIIFIFLSLAVHGQTVISIHIDASINPATAEFIERSIKKAAKEKAECLLIHFNTPGGLLKSTRKIVGDILESPVPVVVYVSPAGAQAASAGVFITLAANISAMSPGTNIGAAHPVSMQSGMDTIMSEKVTNDAVAFIKTIAEKRNRNVEWAEQAVRQSVSITGAEAVNQKVVDLIAVNEKQLLELIDGRTAEVSSGMVTLHTRSAKIEEYEMGFIEKLLNILSDPNIAYILLMLGFYGIMFELYNPGSTLPGIVGVICLILAFYSMHTLPINYAGLALIIFALVLFLLEIKIASHGVLAIGGIISLLLGSMMLIRTGSGDVGRISWSVIISAVAVTSLFFLFVIGMGLKAQRLKVVTGVGALVDKVGVVTEELAPLGMVRVNGELWKAESLAGTIGTGEKIVVVRMEGFKLFVEKASEIQGV